MTTQTNDDIIFVLFGQDYPKQNFSMEAREFKKIKDWMQKWELDSLDLYSDMVYYKIAENITPLQMNKFVGLYEYEQAKNLMIEHEFGREDYDSWIKEYATDLIKEKVEELKVYNDIKLPKYHNGREVVSYPNAGVAIV